MKSFEFDYLYDTSLSHDLLKSVTALGAFLGRQELYNQQTPEVLESLRKAAMVELLHRYADCGLQRI